MNWLLEHFQVVIAVIVIVAWILRSIAGAEQQERPPRTGRGAPAEDAAEAERTRQIQEEIRRRILARQRGETIAPAPPPMPPPEGPPPMPAYVEAEETEEVYPGSEYPGEGPRESLTTATARREAEAAQAAILEQQRRIAEQLHALREARPVRGDILSPPARLPHEIRVAVPSQHGTLRQELIRDLHHPASLRRAILLKEILGQPLGLRRDAAVPGL